MSEPREQPQQLQTGELALKCAQFFMSLGESCLQFYHKYNQEKERKTKMIKKMQRQNHKVVRRNQGEDGDEELKKIPRKPLTAYIIYFQEKKPNFVEKHPDLNLSELTKLIAKEWKEIDNSIKKPYLEQAQEDRKRYENEMKEFKAKFGHTEMEVEQEEQENLIEMQLDNVQDIINDHQQKQNSHEMQENQDNDQDIEQADEQADELDEDQNDKHEEQRNGQNCE